MAIKLTGKDGKTLTWKEATKDGYTINYWIRFPNGIGFNDNGDGRSSFSTALFADTRRRAFQLAKKYNASYIERVLNTPSGRWCLGWLCREGDEGLSIQEVWDRDVDLPMTIKREGGE